MKRREFLQAGAQAAVLASAAGRPAMAAPAVQPTPGSPEANPSAPQRTPVPAVLATYTADDHRRRLTNIAFGSHAIRSAVRQHLITDYLPGQCAYNLGEYPSLKPWNPDDVDERNLDRLHADGIRLVQVHDEWSDSLRRFGGNRFTPVNPAGFRRFIEMVHRRGMRLIVYISSGFFERPDRDFHPEWAMSHNLVEAYWHNALCSPASPGWRAYFLPRLTRLLDDWGIDGIYNDLGYLPVLEREGATPAADEVLPFEETPQHDSALADLLAMIYAEVKRRGGIVKVHGGGAGRPQTDLKVYDYLWIGEGSNNGSRLREATKHHPPYVVPCLDMSRGKIDREEDLYLDTIPYLQFPLLLAGRPFTGQRATVPGVAYPPPEKCHWTHHARAIWKFYQEHPEGPYSYGWWDSVPGRPEAPSLHALWLRRYLPLVEEGTWAWLGIGASDLFAQPLPADVTASAFANRRAYLVLANYGRTPVEIATTSAYVSVTEGPAPSTNRWRLETRSLQILAKE